MIGVDMGMDLAGIDKSLLVNVYSVNLTASKNFLDWERAPR